MTVKENHTILSRATIRAIVITALVAVAAVFSTQNTGVAFGSCPYTPNSGDQADLWFDMGSEDTYFTDAEWPGLEVKTFSLKGPFRGDINIRTYTGWGLTTSTTSSKISCTTAQSYTVTKNAESMPIYLKRCNWGDHTSLQFGITHERKCILNAGQSNIYPMIITESDMEGTPLTYSTGGEDGRGTQNTATTTETTYTPPEKPEKLVLEKNAAGCDATGSLDSSLAITYVYGEERGPTTLNVSWSRVPTAQKYCIHIQHSDPSTVPEGVAEFPEEGWTVWAHESFINIDASGAEIGGDDFPGFYAGGEYLVTVQAIDDYGNYGPATSGALQTHQYKELGAVQNAAVYEDLFTLTGKVAVRWDAAPGQPKILQWRGEDDVIVEWREDGQDYSPERTVSMYYAAAYEGAPFVAYTPRLTPDTNYTFRITPKRINMPDGDPVEVVYRIRKLGPPTVNIRRLEFTGIHWLSIFLESDRALDTTLVSVRLESGQVMEYSNERGSYRWVFNITMQPPGETCVKVTGIVGIGEDAVTGQWSDETCIEKQPDTTTSVGRFQQAATRVAEQLKKAGILPGQGATKVKTGPAWPALYFGAFRVAEVVQENEVPLISTTK